MKKFGKIFTFLMVFCLFYLSVKAENSPLMISFDKLEVDNPKLKMDSFIKFKFDGKNEVRTLWPAITDKASFLAIDLNHNGRIDSGLELFGNYTAGSSYNDGFEALTALLDKNKDNIITGNELNNLLIWHDKNSNGKTEFGELVKAKRFGLKKIDLKDLKNEKVYFEENAFAIPFAKESVLIQRKSSQKLIKANIFDIWFKEFKMMP